MTIATQIISCGWNTPHFFAAGLLTFTTMIGLLYYRILSVSCCFDDAYLTPCGSSKCVISHMSLMASAGCAGAENAFDNAGMLLAK